MSRFTDWLYGKPSAGLDLKKYTPPMDSTSRVSMPKPPMLEVTPWSLSRYATKSELVYACIEKKAQAMCDPELIVQRRTSKGDWEKVEGHPALRPFTLPNPFDDQESFLRTWVASENIAAIFYAEIIFNSAGQPVQLYPLRPDCMFEEYRETAKGPILEYYAYRVNGYEYKFKPEELLIRHRHGLGSMFSRISPLQVALDAVDADLSATEYVRAFYNNDGTPSGILKVNGKSLTNDEADHLRQRWQSNYSRQGKNRGGVAVLDENADYESVGARLNELNSDSLTSIDESRICMAFGVPPILIGAYVGLLHVNQRASVREAQQDFWMNTISPELKAIRNFLTHKFLPYFEDQAAVEAGQVRYFWDISTVEALQDDVDELHDRIALGYKTGFYKLDEARAKVGLDAVGPEAGGEEFFKPAAPAVGMPEDEPPPEPKRLRDRDGKADILDAATLEKKTVTFEDLTLRRELSVAEQRIDIKAIFDEFEGGKDALLPVVQDIRRQLIAQVVEAIGRRSDRDVFTLTLTPPKAAYKQVERVITASVQAGRMLVAREAMQKAEFKASSSEEFIRKLIELTVSRIINEVQTAAINIFTALGVLGLERDEVEDRIRQELDDRSDAPFEGIARQAINEAVNEGRREEQEARQDEIARYEYSAILDANTCGPCEAWDGVAAVDVSSLPETPNAECEGWSNCRCFIISIFETEAA